MSAWADFEFKRPRKRAVRGVKAREREEDRGKRQKGQGERERWVRI